MVALWKSFSLQNQPFFWSILKKYTLVCQSLTILVNILESRPLQFILNDFQFQKTFLTSSDLTFNIGFNDVMYTSVHMKNFSLNFQKPVLISKASLTEINLQSQFSEREFFQHIIIIANSYVKQLKQNVSSLGQSSGIIFSFATKSVFCFVNNSSITASN